MEEFRNIEGYEGYYEVSNYGNVKSFHRNKETILKPTFSKGYFQVTLCKKGSVKYKTIHKLVAEAFLNHKPCGSKLVINHINFNILDNRVENLEIVTTRENSNQKHLKSSSKYTGVSWDKNSNKWKSQIWINRKKKHLGYFINELEASNAYQNELKQIFP